MPLPYKLGKQVSPICNRPTGSLPPQRAVGYLFYNDSAQKTPAVRKNVRGMNAPNHYKLPFLFFSLITVFCM